MIRIGVAGWDYPDWVGPVYPEGSSRRMDRLAFISRYVDIVEINSTFYRPVPPRVAESWLRRTASREARFTFSAKAHRSWSHEEAFDPGSDLAPTLEGLRPLRDGGRLSALLLQFPQSFRHDSHSRDRLQRLAEPLEGWPLVVEVRHAGWQEEEAESWFDRLGFAWCVVDQPRVGRSTARSVPRVTGSPAYLRLHGRNRANWFREGAGRDARYDYLYTDAEVADLAVTARRMAEKAEELIVVQNNHFRGQALVNALQMKHLLQGGRPPAPETLAEAFPGLASTVAVERSRLF
jgi:uncharacterized protein YecE (DUF72 family)